MRQLWDFIGFANQSIFELVSTRTVVVLYEDATIFQILDCNSRNLLSH